MSFYAVYHSLDGKTLVGGVIDSETSRFQRREDVETRISSIKEVNAGRKIRFQIIESELPPEIFHHCNDVPATCVGCVCSGCGKLLTDADAEAAARR